MELREEETHRQKYRSLRTAHSLLAWKIPFPMNFGMPYGKVSLAWNEAFEAAGFKNAVVVKQMPDDAEWDPADVRYSTVRWLFQPGSGYAVGPSRANPYTGELYDADIRISADFVRCILPRANGIYCLQCLGQVSMDFDSR